MRVLSILIVLLHPNVERHYGVVAVSDGVRGDKVARLNFIGHPGTSFTGVLFAASAAEAMPVNRESIPFWKLLRGV